MSETDEKIGYLESNVEHIVKRQDDIIVRLDTLEKLITDKFRTVEITFKILRFLGLAAVALATLQFGDIPRLWAHFF